MQPVYSSLRAREILRYCIETRHQKKNLRKQIIDQHPQSNYSIKLLLRPDSRLLRASFRTIEGTIGNLIPDLQMVVDEEKYPRPLIDTGIVL